MSLSSHCWIMPLTNGRGGEMGTGPGVHNAYNWDSTKPGCGAYKESNIYREQSGPSMPRQTATTSIAAHPRSHWPLLYGHYPAANYMHYMHHWPNMVPEAPKRKRSAPKRKSPEKRKKPTKNPVKKTAVKRKKPTATRKSHAKK